MSASDRSDGAQETQRVERAVKAILGGQYPEARRVCARLLRSEGRNAGVLHLLALTASAEGRFKTSEKLLVEATRLDRKNAAWFRDLSVVRMVSENWAGALAAATRAVQIDPGNASAHGLEARALRELKENERALPVYKRWSRLEPTCARARVGTAECLFALGRLRDAEHSARAALRLDPELITAHELLAEILFRLGRHDMALRHRLEVIRLLPGNTMAEAQLALAYYQCGATEIAARMLSKAVKRGVPVNIHSVYLAVLLHHPRSTAKSIVREHRQWARLFASAPVAGPPLPNHRSQRLRIAYLCAEPITSPVFRFLIPLFRHHNRDAFEIALYHTDISWQGRARDCELRETELRDVSGCTPQAIAKRMRRDRIDILVDVSGHFGGGALAVAAMRAAPVQVAFPSYPATTGLPQMDYIFTDRWTCAGGQERQYTEQPCWIDSGYLVYDPPPWTGAVGLLPALKNGYITYGLFQRPAKLNARVWDAIAKILQKTVGSRLLIHHASTDLDAPESASRARINAELTSRGVSAGCLEFRGAASPQKHMRLVAAADIALDSFPYTGQTTTCECLWLGVPVVTVAGETHVSRVCAGLLTRAGLDWLVAQSATEYVKIAIDLAREPRRLAALRRGMRERMRRSSVLDGERLARNVETAYRSMCRRGGGFSP